MAIQNRFGDINDFDPNKMVTAEWAFPSDGYAYYCVSPGVVKKVVTAEEIQGILNASTEAYTALQSLLLDLEANPSELTNILNDIVALQSLKLDKTGDSKDNTVTFTEALVETNIASTESHATIFGKILKSIKTFRSALAELTSGKIDKTSIIQTTEVNDSAKVPSSAVTYALNTLISNLTTSVNSVINSLAVSSVAFPFTSGIADSLGQSFVRKSGKIVTVNIRGEFSTPPTANISTLIGTLPVGCRPMSTQYIFGFSYLSTTSISLVWYTVGTDGTVKAFISTIGTTNVVHANFSFVIA